jgi:dienelactone hydrolase
VHSGSDKSIQQTTAKENWRERLRGVSFGRGEVNMIEMLQVRLRAHCRRGRDGRAESVGPFAKVVGTNFGPALKRSALLPCLVLLAVTGASRISGAADGILVTFPSASPYTIAEAYKTGLGGSQISAKATLFRAERGTSSAARLPAVVVIQGSNGITPGRELEYGSKLAARGMTTLVIDSYGSRGITEETPYARWITATTETMLAADAFAGLRFLSQEPAVDARRVAVMGFSYGGIVTQLATQESLAAAFSPEGLRFAAHVDFYGPCLLRFSETRTTGAPILMLFGGKDGSLDLNGCQRLSEDLERGGSPTTLVIYPDAPHAWNMLPEQHFENIFNPVRCHVEIGADGSMRETGSRLAFTDAKTRVAMLQSCGTNGYVFGRHNPTWAKSDPLVFDFLRRALADGEP